MPDVDAPDEIEHLRRRTTLLDAFVEGPLEKSTLIDAVHYGRATVSRALDDLVEASFVKYTPEGYVATQVAKLCVRRHREFRSEGHSDDDVALLEKRGELLSVLVSEPHHKPELVETTGDSRSTINRGIAALNDRGWVRKGPGGHRCTDLGRSVWSEYRSYVADLQSILDAREVLLAIPPRCEIPWEAVVGARCERCEPRRRLFEVLSRDLPTADRYWATSPSVTDSRHLRLWHRQVVDRDLDVVIVGSTSVLNRFGEEFPYLVGDLAESDSVSALAVDPPPYGLHVISQPGTAEPETRVVVVGYDDGIDGVLTTTDPDAVAWAKSRCQRLADEGRAASDDLGQSVATSEFARITGDRLPRRLRSQGFVRLGDAYFERNDPLEPRTAYRAGVGLPEARAGYVAERRDSEGVPVSDRLVDDLASGTDAVLLGPAGSGKSTVLKRVATRWDEADRGTVFYRPAGRGRPLDPAALTSLLDAMAGEALVAVEDAARPDANGVFQVMRSFSGDDSVKFLLDSRASEWHDPSAVSNDARLDAFRRGRVQTRHVPEFDADDRALVVERVEDVTGASIDAAPERLLPDETGPAVAPGDAEGATPGAAFLFFYRLSLYLEPVDDAESGATKLGQHVDEVRADLESTTGVAPDVGLLVATLKASGVDLDPAYLFSLSGDTREMWETLDRLEGDVLFETSNGASYDALHEVWASEYLRRYHEAVGPREASARFVDCLDELLSMADDPERRSAVGDAVGETPGLKRLREAPDEWAASVARRTSKLAKRLPKTAPLFVTFHEAIDFPESIPDSEVHECYRAIGRGFYCSGRYDDAERFVELPPADDSPAVLERRRELALIASARGNTDRALELANEALAEADEGSETYGKLLEFESNLLRKTGRLRESKAVTTKQREFAERSANPSLRASATCNLGRVALQRGRTATAREHFEEALEEFRDLGERWRLHAPLSGLSAVELRDRNYEKAREYTKWGLKVHRETGRLDQRGHLLLNLGVIEQSLDHLDEALDHYERCLELVRERGRPRTEADVTENLAVVALEKNDLTEAAEYARRSVELNRETGDASGLAGALTTFGAIQRGRGNHDEARATLEEGLELSRETGYVRGEVLANLDLALLARDLDDPGTARDRFERATNLADRTTEEGIQTTARIDWGAFEAQRGTRDRAERLLGRVLDARDGDPDQRALASGLLAAVRIERDGPGAGRDRRRESIERLQDYRDPKPLVRVYVHNARAEFLNGDPTVGEKLLGRARAVIDEYDLVVPYLERQLGAIPAR